MPKPPRRAGFGRSKPVPKPRRDTAAEKARAADRRAAEVEERRVAAARAWAAARSASEADNAAAAVLAGDTPRVEVLPSTKIRWQQLRVLVHARDRERCARCAAPLKLWQMQCHHRTLRSQGGVDEPGNLVCLCGRCHDHVHAHPVSARLAGGWIVPSTEDYWEVPVLISAHGWVRLANDGGVFPLEAV